MSSLENEVFISYAWGSVDNERERIVNEIDKALQERKIKLVRDKQDLGYKGSINDFMERIGRGNCVIVVISDKYLRSKNCMKELTEIAKNQAFHDRIFPVILQDADIYNAVNQIKYIKYWEDKIAELDEALKSVNSANLQGLREEIDLYDEIRDNIARLINILDDMNTLTPEMHENAHFSHLIDALDQRIRATALIHLPETTPEKEETLAPLQEKTTSPKPQKKSASRKAAKSTPSTAPDDTYIQEVLHRLERDGYELIDEQRFGRFRFQHAARKTVKWLMGFSGEYHFIVFLEHDIPNEQAYRKLAHEVQEYASYLGKNSPYLNYVTCIVTTEDVDDQVSEQIYEIKLYTKSKGSGGGIKESLTIVYSRQKQDIFYPKDFSDDIGPAFREKIEKYLMP